MVWTKVPISHLFRDYQQYYVSQPHFGLSVKMKLTLPKVGTWSPLGLPKTQSLIVGVKTRRIGCSLYHWKGLEV